MLAPTFLSGCACTNYVKNMGKTKAYRRHHTASIDDGGNIVCIVKVLRRSLNDYDSTEDLGYRYVIRNAPYGGEAIRNKIRNDHSFERRGKMYVQVLADRFDYPKNDDEAKNTKSWYLYPPDLMTEIQKPDPPEHLSKNTFEQYLYAGGLHEPELEYSFDGQKYYVDVHIDSQLRGHPDRIHQEKWAYPMRVLLMPAYVIDVVTFPIQVYVEAVKLGSAFP